MKRKICVVITARPSYARIKTALQAIKDHPKLELQLVVAASALLDRFGATINVIRSEGFEPDATVYMVVEGENLITSAKSTGLGIVELASTFDRLKPDCVLTIADRYETIATAITGCYMNIPVAHVQGGEVSGSIDDKVRHSVTKLSDIHFVSNQIAADRVRKMGEQTAAIHITGCPSIDLALNVKNQGVSQMPDMKTVGASFDINKDYIIVMNHPVTYEHEDAEKNTVQLLEAVNSLGMQALWFWPNVDAGSDSTARAIRKFREKNSKNLLSFMKNLPPEAFLHLLNNSKCIVGNSSVGIRESAFLGIGTVNVGSRQRDRERAPNVIDVGHNTVEIKSAIEHQIKHGRYATSTIYGDGFAGQRIADILAEASLTTEKRLSY